MKATTKNMAEAITQALDPIFRDQPDYKTICEAMALTVARVAQSTPDKGKEHAELEEVFNLAHHALEQFLNEEEAIQEAKAKTILKGIEAFSEMASSHGIDSHISAEEFYKNSGLNPKHYGPVNGLAAINGGVSPEACAEAEEFAGRFHDDKGRLTEEGFEQLKKDVIALHTPDPEEASWSNSPIHQEIARLEQEHPELDPSSNPDTYNPDGPRAYAP